VRGRGVGEVGGQVPLGRHAFDSKSSAWLEQREGKILAVTAF
jgi:hypothetical protein